MSSPQLRWTKAVKYKTPCNYRYGFSIILQPKAQLWAFSSSVHIQSPRLIEHLKLFFLFCIPASAKGVGWKWRQQFLRWMGFKRWMEMELSFLQNLKKQNKIHFLNMKKHPNKSTLNSSAFSFYVVCMGLIMRTVSGWLPRMMEAFRFYAPVQIVPNAAARMHINYYTAITGTGPVTVPDQTDPHWT